MKTSNRIKAQDAFLKHRAQILADLARLTAHAEDHFGVGAEDVNWGYAGDAEALAEGLRELTDRAFNEGEYK